MEQIRIDSGNYQEYEIVDTKGKKIGVITIDTTDFGIIERAEKAADNIKKIMEETHQEKDMKVVGWTDKAIRKEIDYIFNSNVSEIVFGKQHCLNLKNGKTLVERFMEAMIPVIKKNVQKESSAAEKRTNKYTDAYTKKNMPPYGSCGKSKKRKKRYYS